MRRDSSIHRLTPLRWAVHLPLILTCDSPLIYGDSIELFTAPHTPPPPPLSPLSSSPPPPPPPTCCLPRDTLHP
ncbi:hypothetical protein E2C01_065536 [Portunus trituberculatus]|uniref:Uncharacterized protein n=1 Tax=Portunus trituberculatus TaxID=210409 RepID=A0A5B7HS07_PORTR|nr:hypothetical protein [Portunus trituberculatus]